SVAHLSATAASDVVKTVKASEDFHGGVDCGGSGLWLGSIADQSLGRGAKRSFSLRDTFRITPDHENLRPRVNKGLGGRQSQTRGAADDNDYFIGEFRIHQLNVELNVES